MQSTMFDTSVDPALPKLEEVLIKTEEVMIKTEPMEQPDSDQSECFQHESHADSAEYILPDLTISNNGSQVSRVKSEALEQDDSIQKFDQCSTGVVSEGEESGGISTDAQLLARTVDGCKIYFCQHCQYNTTNSSNMRNHLTTHTKEKPFKCSVCTHSCSQAGNLKKHMTTHTGERSHKCTVCSYSCSQAFNLKKHILTHSRLRPYECTVCSFSCSQSGSLRSHMATHTGVKAFACPQCAFKTAHKSYFVSHALNHSGRKPFGCGHCGYSSAFKQNLTVHMAKKHSDHTIADLTSIGPNVSPGSFE